MRNPLAGARSGFEFLIRARVSSFLTWPIKIDAGAQKRGRWAVLDRLWSMFLGPVGGRDQAELSKVGSGGGRACPGISKRRPGHHVVQDKGPLLRSGHGGDRGEVSMGMPMGDDALPMGDVFKTWACLIEAKYVPSLFLRTCVTIPIDI